MEKEIFVKDEQGNFVPITLKELRTVRYNQDKMINKIKPPYDLIDVRSWNKRLLDFLDTLNIGDYCSFDINKIGAIRQQLWRLNKNNNKIFKTSLTGKEVIIYREK